MPMTQSQLTIDIYIMFSNKVLHNLQVAVGNSIS